MTRTSLHGSIARGPLLWAGGAGAALVALGLAVTALPAGCVAPSRADLGGARAALERARAAGGVERAPEACAGAHAMLLLAEVEARVQARRSLWSRDWQEAIRLALAARLRAESCEAHARAAEERVRRRAESVMGDVEAGIRHAAALARHVPDDEGVRGDLLRAEIALGEGRSAFDRGQYERATAAVERARGELRAAGAEITRFVERMRTSPRRRQWRRWIAETLDESRRTGRAVILVDKLRRQLLLYDGGAEIATYAVDLGAGGIDHKTRAGDEATPEGRYHVTEVRGPGQTRYYRALMLDYPNEDDRARYRRLVRSGRVAPNHGIGGDIEIHGHGGREQDWTQGCVALEDDDMDDLVPRVAVGTAVTIVGMIPEGVLP